MLSHTGISRVSLDHDRSEYLFLADRKVFGPIPATSEICYLTSGGLVLLCPVPQGSFPQEKVALSL